jgi:nicotinamide phosphoribosyltransferase
MLDRAPTGLIACVIDSYDTHRAVAEIFGGKLREKVFRRGGTVVLRPDSGDPCVVIEDIFNVVAEKFGFETNNKGWKVLPKQIRLIQGDGVNYQNILRINSHLTRAGWSMDNWGYGMGGALLQQQNRDTMRFAIKCSAIKRDGSQWDEVRKVVITDPSKASIGGRFDLLRFSDGEFETVNTDYDDRAACGAENVLQTVFENGKMLRHQTLDEIRELSNEADRYNEEE